MTDQTYLFILNSVGLIAFAFSVALKAIMHNLDLFGIIFLGFATALGGGAIRDVLVQRVPLMLTDISYTIFTLIGVVGAIVLKKETARAMYTKVFLISDGIGLASFTATGCIVAYQEGLGIIGIIVLGMSTAIGGGIIRDILVNEIPMVLNREIYATCSFVGCIFFWILVQTYGIQSASYISLAIVFILRVFSIIFRWNLPRFS